MNCIFEIFKELCDQIGWCQKITEEEMVERDLTAKRITEDECPRSRMMKTQLQNRLTPACGKTYRAPQRGRKRILTLEQIDDDSDNL